MRFRYLGGQEGEITLPIPFSHTEEDQKALLDISCHTAIHTNLGRFNPLNYSTHLNRVRLTRP